MTTTKRCFVCGESFDDIKLLVTHMEQQHIPERDFIMCTQCGIPLRDVRSHYRAIHPYSQIQAGPSNVQRMYSTGSGKPKKRKGRHVGWRQGDYFSEKMRRMMHYRSSWELDIIKILDMADCVESFAIEPFPIRYAYANKYANYLPDFHVRFKNGHNALVEIKPQRECNTAMNTAKWDAAEAWCKANGFIFRVWTEAMIAKLKRISKNPLNLTESTMLV